MTRLIIIQLALLLAFAGIFVIALIDPIAGQVNNAMPGGMAGMENMGEGGPAIKDKCCLLNNTTAEDNITNGVEAAGSQTSAQVNMAHLGGGNTGNLGNMVQIGNTIYIGRGVLGRTRLSSMAHMGNMSNMANMGMGGMGSMDMGGMGSMDMGGMGNMDMGNMGATSNMGNNNAGNMGNMGNMGGSGTGGSGSSGSGMGGMGGMGQCSPGQCSTMKQCNM